VGGGLGAPTCAGGLTAAGLPSGVSVSITQGNLTLVQGARYRTLLRAVTAAGRWSEREGPTLLVDATGPEGGVAEDGSTVEDAPPACAYCNTDVDYTPEAGVVRVRGVGFTDPETGISRVLVGASSRPCDGLLRRACPALDPSRPVYTQPPCSPLEGRWRAALAGALGYPPGSANASLLGAPDGSGPRVPFNLTDPDAFDVAPLVDLGATESPSHTWVLPSPLPQGTLYFTCVIAENGAGLRTAVASDGVVVDTTPPTLTYVADGLDFVGRTDWQASNMLDGLSAHWVAGDDESGLLWSEVAFTLDPSPVAGALAELGWNATARAFAPAATDPVAYDWAGVQAAVAAGLSDAQLRAARAAGSLPTLLAAALALPPVALVSPFGAAGLANLLIRGGLNLTAGNKYFAVVRALNKAGAYSHALASDGIVAGVNEVARPPPGETATVSFNTASAATAGLTPEEQRAAGAGTVGALAMPSEALEGASSLSAGTVSDAELSALAAQNKSTAGVGNNMKFGNYSFAIHARGDDGGIILGFKFAKHCDHPVF